MAERTPYQKGIIRRYYEHRDTIAIQKLSEAVSNLYLETDETKIKRAWKSVSAQMLSAGVKKGIVERVVEKRDLEELAKIVSELT